MGLTVTGLAVARSLGRRGIDIIATHSGQNPLASRSRYLRALCLPASRKDSSLLQFYLELGRQLGSAVLLPTGDRNVRFIARHREALAKHFSFYIGDRELLDLISSKRDFAAFAERREIALPTTLLPGSSEELEASIDRLRFPCVIKPEFTHLWQTEAARQAGVEGLKALPVQDPETMVRVVGKLMRVDPRIVVQQMIVGPDENHVSYHAFIDPEGNLRAEFIGRKIRLAPPHYGMGSYVESIHSDEVRREGSRILRELDYRGLGAVQFKRDERDGRLYVMEMGIRFNVYTGLAVACGVDFPYYTYKTCLQEPFSTASDYVDGKAWWNPLDDLRSMRVYVRDGTWSWSRWLVSVMRFPVNAYFAWDDPMPGVALLHRLSKAGLQRMFGRRRPG